MIDAVVPRVCSGRQLSRIAASDDFDRHVSRRGADGLKRLNEAADGTLANKGIVGSVNRCRGNGRQIGCYLCRNKSLAFAVGKHRQ